MKNCNSMKYLIGAINPRYTRQQAIIDNVCKALNLEPFRPDYHGATGDKNTVLIYTPEQMEHNNEIDRKYGTFAPNNLYKQPIFTFENTDINGYGSYDFANRGKIDLRGIDEQTAIYNAIRTALEQHNNN